MSEILWVDGWPHHDRVRAAHGLELRDVRYTEREVDALLCERVLGWVPWGDSQWTLPKDGYAKETPDFAHDIRAAMLLAKGLPPGFWIMWSSGRWVALFDASCEHGESLAQFDAKHGEEAAAIRLASLKALELQEARP